MLVLAVLAGCGPKALHMLTCEEYYQAGLRNIERKHWLQAQADFQAITLNYPGCDLVDDAQYMLGETYFLQGQYVEAEFEYRRLVEDFRLSDRMEDAQFKLALSAYKQTFPAQLDQTPTEGAIFRFQQYLEDFPSGRWAADARRYIQELRKRLAKKDFEAARYYHRQSYQDAALIYLDHILTEYSDTGEWVEQARYMKAEILIARRQPQEALALLRAIDQDAIKPGLREDVQRTIARLQRDR